MLPYFAILACLLHASHGQDTHRDQSPKFDVRYEPPKLVQKPQSICYTYMTTVLITLPADRTTSCKHDVPYSKFPDDPGDPADPADPGMPHSTPPPEQYVTHLSGAKHGTVPGGMAVAGGQTRILANQPSVITIEATVLPIPMKLPTLPVVIGVTRGRFSNMDPSQLSDGFVGDPSSGTSFDCSGAQVFTLDDGRLQSNGKLLSVDPGVEYVDINSVLGGKISSGFDSEDGLLTWRNTEFSGGIAGFCKAMDGHIYATFTNSGGPAGCITVYLTVYHAERCQNGVIVDTSGMRSIYGTATPKPSGAISTASLGDPIDDPAAFLTGSSSKKKTMAGNFYATVSIQRPGVTHTGNDGNRTSTPGVQNTLNTWTATRSSSVLPEGAHTLVASMPSESPPTIASSEKSNGPVPVLASSPPQSAGPSSSSSGRHRGSVRPNNDLANIKTGPIASSSKTPTQLPSVTTGFTNSGTTDNPPASTDTTGVTSHTGLQTSLSANRVSINGSSTTTSINPNAKHSRPRTSRTFKPLSSSPVFPSLSSPPLPAALLPAGVLIAPGSSAAFSAVKTQQSSQNVSIPMPPTVTSRVTSSVGLPRSSNLSLSSNSVATGSLSSSIRVPGPVQNSAGSSSYVNTTMIGVTSSNLHPMSLVSSIMAPLISSIPPTRSTTTPALPTSRGTVDGDPGLIVTPISDTPFSSVPSPPTTSDIAPSSIPVALSAVTIFPPESPSSVPSLAQPTTSPTLLATPSPPPVVQFDLTQGDPSPIIAQEPYPVAPQPYPVAPPAYYPVRPYPVHDSYPRRSPHDHEIPEDT